MKVIFNNWTAFLVTAACVGPDDSHDTGPIRVALDNPGNPIADLDDEWETRFLEGDAKFETPFLDTQGLGPVYIRTSCSACHGSDGRGPGTVQKMVLVDADGFTPAKDQSVLAWGNTVRPYTAGGAITPITPPEDVDGLLLTTRIPPPVMGRGYMDAVEDSEIERVAAEQAQRSDAIHGRVNYVVYQSARDPDNEFHALDYGDAAIGRFGLKARVGTADDFAADAYQGDMSLTSPFRPDELPNPDSLLDDDHAGTDIDIETVQSTGDYIRLLEIPPRASHPDGEQVFEDVGCAVCHAPSLHTRADYPVPALADTDAWIYSDLLLHDMGKALADGMTESEAGPRDWKTPPLIGLRFQLYFLHDGRAATVEDAIVQHDGDGSEASDVVAAFESLDDEDRQALLTFVESL